MKSVDDSLSAKLFSTHIQDLHAKAKTQSLTPTERAEYERVRDDLARMLVFAQQLVCRPGEKYRQALRVRMELAITLTRTRGGGQSMTGKTIDASSGGFAAALPHGLDVDERVDVSIVAPFGEPIAARARVVAATKTDGACRASFAFQDLAPQTLERLDVLVFDQVLPQLSSVLAPIAR